MNFWSKRIKNTSVIANKIGVDEEKIKELKNGEREIEGETFNKVLEAIEDEKINRNITNMEILQWYKDTDLKALREKFGYKSQLEVAKILGCDSSTICNFEKKREGFANNVSPRLEQLYYFYKNGFNKKILKKKEIEIKNESKKSEILKWYSKSNIKSYRIIDGVTLRERAKEIGIPASSLNDLENRRTKKYTINMEIVYNFYKKFEDDEEENKEIWDWYLNTDIKKLRLKEGITQKELAKKIECSQPCVADIESKRTKSVSSTMRAIYSYYNKIKKNNNTEIQSKEDKVESVEDKIYDWYKSIKDLREYRRNFGYSLNKFMSALNLSYDQARTFERHEYKKTTPIVMKIYNFYQDENNRLPKIEWEPNENNTFVEKQDEQSSTNEVVDALEITKNDEILLLENRIKHQELKIKELELQLSRYEKLIDRL